MCCVCVHRLRFRASGSLLIWRTTSRRVCTPSQCPFTSRLQSIAPPDSGPSEERRPIMIHNFESCKHHMTTAFVWSSSDPAFIIIVWWPLSYILCMRCIIRFSLFNSISTDTVAGHLPYWTFNPTPSCCHYKSFKSLGFRILDNSFSAINGQL